MFETRMLNNLVRGLDPVHSKTINLRPGQVFQGTITNLYPGQLAQLKLGNMSLSARLEAQLEKGERYWFRVMAGEGIPKLKVIENLPPSQSSSNQAANAQSILQRMGVSQGSAQERLLQQLNQLNQPFTRDNIEDGARVLQQSSLPRQTSLDLISNMIQRGMPLTKDTFQALAAIQSNRSFSETMQQLQSQLNTAQYSSGANQQLQQVLSQMMAQSDPLRQGGTLQGLLQQMNSSDGSLQQQAVQMARQLGVMPQSMSETQFFNEFKAAILRPENQEAVRQLWPQLQRNQGFNLQEIPSRALFSYLINTVRLDQPQSTQQLLSLMNPQASTNYVTGQLDQWLTNQPTDASRALWTMVSESRVDSFSLMNSQKGESPLKMFLQQLGLQHESDLKGASAAQESIRTQNLKASLLQFLQQPQNIPQGARDQAEFLLQRLTGYQLISSEQHGPMQHTLFQVPLKMTSKYEDMTIQWEGRQTKNGSIDESHCRILFYLTLEAIDETVVDVQIQNRITTLTIYNENEKPSSVQAIWYPLLKEKLATLDYQLSAIKWKQPATKNEDGPLQQLGKGYQKDEYGYKGVDVRI
ncbi:hypothetical protein [Salipaludibacillus daqingensis]|uniref:hypothetical protein n=1 Tax=Salipaludibacillus daqingensis TaxID=3041001 RepID=UPI00247402F3|nr:hypothetical protein [Salipaludibacillus daqingensis]